MADELPSKILVIDTDEVHILNIEGFCKKNNITCEKAKTWENALYLFNTQKFDLVIMSLFMDKMMGTTLIQKWRKHEIEYKRNVAYIIAISGKRESAHDYLVQELGDIPIVAKPINPIQLMTTIAQACKTANQTSAITQVEQKIILPLIKQGKAEKALGVAKEKLEPQGAKGQFISATIHSDATEYPHAIKVLEQLAQAEPKNMKYQNELGKIHLKMNDLDKAQKYFEAADAQAPAQLERLQELADIYLRLNDPGKAAAKYTQLIQMNPDEPDLKFNFFENMIKRGYPEEARKLSAQTSTTQELLKYYNNKGVVSAKQGHQEGAIKEYQMALNLMADTTENHRVYFNMAIAHINLKSPDNLKQAKTLLEKCLKLKPDYDKAREKLKIVDDFLKNAAA